jgi:hypothetical protein
MMATQVVAKRRVTIHTYIIGAEFRGNIRRNPDALIPRSRSLLI